LRLIARDLLPKQIKNEQLYKLAQKIGADVPVCLMPDWQIMTGTGTQTQPGSRPRSIDAPIYAVLANPQIHLSTAEIFAQINFYSAANLSQLKGFIASGALADIIAIGNDMAAPVCAKYPEIAALIDHLNMPHDGFIGAGMSGSGASCFALTKNKEAAEKCCTSLSEKNIWAQVTRMRD
jgi:4-diphosphocytidyl-2-C-methyl-D-erythritol kinase